MQKINNPYINELPINKAAETANVSVATIRNWIKTGYLTETKKGFIDIQSFETFMQDIAGKEKLNSRANKSQKDNHNHDELTAEIAQKIANTEVNPDDLGNEYEALLSNSYRNKEGIYYTPAEIITDMLDGISINETTTFCDPSCGSGNFIIEALKMGINPENIYGFDIDQNAVAITKKRIFEHSGYKSENIICADFLEHLSSDKQNNYKFDFIFTNPPWGKKLNKTQKEKYGKIFNSGNSLDTSSLFFFASIKILNNHGKLGFLLPEAFFNIAIFQDARKLALKYKIERFIDYGKSFKGLLTKAQAIILEKSPPKKNNRISCKSGNNTFSRTQHSFEKNPKKIFNFWVNNNDAEIIEHVYKIPHVTLENNAKWALGIVTGNNKNHCSNTLKQGYVPVYKGSDIQKNKLKEPSCFILNDFSLYQQVAPLEFYKAPVKIIYKFISSNLAFYCDTKQKFILNSANVFIPEKNIEISAQQLTDLLNSEFVNWLFKSIFNTHKILRKDLEALPIHVDFFKKNTSFTEKNFLEFLNISKTKNGNYEIF